MKRIGIIGGGISGLYFANIINNHPEFDYKIFEKRSSFDLEEGYGVQLSVNSIKLLNKLGFKNLPASEVYFPRKVNFFQSKNSKKICDIDLLQFNDNQNRYTTLKRSTLIKFLLQNIPKEKIKLDISLSNLEKNNKIKVCFSDKSKEDFDFLVIADGVFSKSRSIIFENIIKPKYNNSIAFRGQLDEYNNNDISIFMGSNFHYVIYPVNQNNEYNFVAILKKKLSEEEANNEKLFENDYFLSPLKKILIKNSDLDLKKLKNLKAYPVFVSDKISLTDQKNIYICGDALFAFPPSFAQGASQSIETAQDIFDSIKNKDDKIYEKRINKIYLVDWRSRLNYFAFQLSNPFNSLIRNLILKFLTKNKKFLENYLGKIYRN